MTQRSDFEEYIVGRNPFESLVILGSAELSAQERSIVPPAWIALSDLDGHDAVEAAVAMWESALPGRFPGTIANLHDRGLDVLIGRAQIRGFDDAQVILIYAIRRNSERLPFDACFGFLPAAPSQLPAFWNRFADGIGRFHTEIHDGFRAKFGGILPARNVRAAEIDTTAAEFEYLDERLEPLDGARRPDLENLLVVVRNGTRGIGVDIASAELNAWEVSERIEPCRLDVWSMVDFYVMGALDSEPEYFVDQGYRSIDG